MSTDRICIALVVRPNYLSVSVTVDNRNVYFGQCETVREIDQRLGEADAIVAEEVHRALTANVH